MSRRVITDVPPSQTRADGAQDRHGKIQIEMEHLPVADDFLGRLVKYIPAEIVGLFIAVRGAIPQDAPPELLSWIAFAAWLLVPVYFWIVTRQGGEKPMIRQIVFATVAFPIWVLALGGAPATTWPWYKSHTYIGSVLLIFVTVIFGWLKPHPGE
jgi:hypothetical protein